MDEQIDLANVHFRNQNYGLAIKIYDGLIRQNDQNYSLYCNRSAALYKLNRFEESLEDAIRAIQLNPKSVKAHFREGMALRSLQKPIDAIVAFSKGKFNFESFKRTLVHRIEPRFHPIENRSGH